MGRFYHLCDSLVKKLTQMGKRLIAMGNRMEHTAAHNYRRVTVTYLFVGPVALNLRR